MLIARGIKLEKIQLTEQQQKNLSVCWKEYCEFGRLLYRNFNCSFLCSFLERLLNVLIFWMQI